MKLNFSVAGLSGAGSNKNNYTHAYFLVLTYNLPSFPTLSGPSVGFIWTGEEIPGIPGEADDDDSMHGKIARILNVVFGLKIIIYVSDNDSMHGKLARPLNVVFGLKCPCHVR